MSILLYDLVGSNASRPFSPHCWKAKMALAHKGVSFNVRPVTFQDVAGVEGGDNRTVPVIRDGDTIVQDSFAIAEYLDRTYPDRPALFPAEGGVGLTRFVESWSQRTIHPFIMSVAVLDIHSGLDEDNRAWFREKREAAYGRTLEEVQDGRTPEKLAAFSKQLEPLRTTLARQAFIAGDQPMFADYIVFSAFQWLRIVSPFRILEDGDPISVWFERCLDLHGGIGRSVAAAAA